MNTMVVHVRERGTPVPLSLEWSSKTFKRRQIGNQIFDPGPKLSGVPKIFGKKKQKTSGESITTKYREWDVISQMLHET